MDAQMDYIPFDNEDNKEDIDNIITETDFFTLINQMDFSFGIDEVLLNDTVNSTILNINTYTFNNKEVPNYFSIEDIEEIADNL